MPKRSGLTPEVIARAALRLLDDDGLEAVTMRAVSAGLDVSPMTLYSHVADREALLDAVAQLVYAEIEVPDGTAGTRETLRELMHAVRTVLLRHPHALPLVEKHPPHDLDALAFVNAGYRALRTAGVDGAAVVSCYRALAAYSLGTATIEVHAYFGAARPQPDQESLRRHLPFVAELGSLPADLDDADEFDLGLDLMLDGFLRRFGIA